MLMLLLTQRTAHPLLDLDADAPICLCFAINGWNGNIKRNDEERTQQPRLCLLQRYKEWPVQFLDMQH